MSDLQPTAYMISTGCLSNLLDGTSYEKLLISSGYRLINDISQADIILINSCAFNQEKEDEVFSYIDNINRTRKSDSRLFICGCLPEINRKRLSEVHTGITFGPRNPDQLKTLLNDFDSEILWQGGPISYAQYSFLKKTIFNIKKIFDTIPVISKFRLIQRLLSPLFVYAKDVYCLKIALGCNGTCAYCAIRFAKGRCISRSYDEIIIELNNAISQGFEKFLLVGDEITAYRNSIGGGQDIIDLIQSILKNPKVRTLYPESFEPGYMISNFKRVHEILASGKIPVFCSSVQSGSDRILKLMKRNYRAEDFARCIRQIKNEFHHIFVRSEFIVGFPDESHDDFILSYNLVKNLNADFIDVYKYEDRPNTIASEMANKIPDDIKVYRRKKLMRQHWKNLLSR
ncbi:MAG: radical SAM protein [Candidatus Zixiibacteriota bacterium]